MTKEINKAIEVLSQGGLICYPTDTVWSIGCDATNEQAVKKIHDLIKSNGAITTICLVANDAMLERYVKNVSDLAYDIMDLATKPTTIIYDTSKDFAKNVLDSNGAVAVRVATDKFCRYLIGKFKKPIVGISANFVGQPISKSFKEIDTAILAGVDYVVNLHTDKNSNNLSSIIRLGNDGTVKIIRH